MLRTLASMIRSWLRRRLLLLIRFTALLIARCRRRLMYRSAFIRREIDALTRAIFSFNVARLGFRLLDPLGFR